MMARFDGDTVNGKVTAAVLPTLSVTLNRMEPLPADVGVPAKMPDVCPMVKPDGSEPAETVHWYGATPPVAASVVE